MAVALIQGCWRSVPRPGAARFGNTARSAYTNNVYTNNVYIVCTLYVQYIVQREQYSEVVSTVVSVNLVSVVQTTSTHIHVQCNVYRTVGTVHVHVLCACFVLCMGCAGGIQWDLDYADTPVPTVGPNQWNDVCFVIPSLCWSFALCFVCSVCMNSIVFVFVWSLPNTSCA